MELSKKNQIDQMQKIVNELATTKSYLQTKEEEVVMLRKDVANANSVQVQLKDQEKTEEIEAANKELESKIVELSKELETQVDQNKTMILQRKTLVSTKEQVQKELEKLLKKTETLESANS